MANPTSGRTLEISIAPYHVKNYEDEYNSLQLHVSYIAGKGFYVNYHPGWKTSMGWSCWLDFSDNKLVSGGSVLIASASRNSQKLLSAYTDNLDQDIARKFICYLFDQRDFDMLETVISNIAIDPNWATEEHLMDFINLHKGASDSINNNSTTNNNNQNSTAMKQNFKAADLIGKVLVIGNNSAKYTIKSVIDDEKVNAIFTREGMSDIAMPMALSSIREMLDKNMAHFEGESVADPADAPKQEQPKAEQPKKGRTTRTKAEPKPEEPAANFEDVDEDAPVQPEEAPKPKAEQPKAEQPKTTKDKGASKGASTKGKYVFASYTTKSGKTGGKILGFDPEDEIYQAGMQFHASKTWERKNGKRVYALIFGPRYHDCAEAICEALNSGAGLDEVIAIADNTTEQNAQERAEKKAEYFAKKAERAERAKEKAAEAQGTTASTGSKGASTKGERLYTEAEVKERIRKAFAALAAAAGIKLEDLEPLIQVA